MTPQDIPPAWAAHYGGARWQRQTIGQSSAVVYRLSPPDQTPLFLKGERQAPLAELPGEIARLAWMAQHGVPCPRIIDVTEHAEWQWLLMSALPGHDLASGPIAPDRLIQLYAEALRRLHAIDIADCPFDLRLERKLTLGAARVAAGLVDEDDFDDSRSGWTAAAVFDALQQTTPSGEDLVVCHGDACLPNLLAENGVFTGFIDCGRLGIADRYQDLALAHRSLVYNLDAAAADAFLDAYGVSAPDRERMAYYRMLDELF
ncbi:aminoglycoside O-phosphotransferase APH(3')-IIb [Devosia yakushimensis]|uniref:Aminoglycoside 3'-phosphotransferase n=1 Tax=Devosia yakushimensis TaxID=470028 RepID=A0ABQ5UDZ6_9HYPH|nr:APH(3') family aminoglycoside O-phosphotransferase [Devosia yakushimensis]GLQ09681.1 aminoglycoside O-phosphotransferase APH(3')-IIb [Devosia yakushimensis]